MGSGIISVLQDYIKNYSNFLSDINNDIDNINSSPSSQYYYWFIGQAINSWTPRYNKDIAKSNLSQVYNALNSLPSFFASLFMPSFTNSNVMNVFARQKLDGVGPWGREEWEFDSIMSISQRKSSVGIPANNNITELFGKFDEPTLHSISTI